MKAIGIDLGTTNSLVAAVVDGRAQVLLDPAGGALLPSVVTYRDCGRILVGHGAREEAYARPKDTVVSVKRFMGRTAEEAASHGLSTYDFEQDGAVLRILAGGKTRTPVEISADILRELRDRARAQLSTDLLDMSAPAVITVPAYFDDTQRQATRDAGRLAGLDVLRLLNEPTAAALAYGLHERAEGKFAVFDLGGGTFDISILQLVDGVFEVLATAGDNELGGDDFDRALAMKLLDEAGIEAAAAGPELRRAAMSAATAAKIALTDALETEVTLPLPDDRTFNRRLARADLDAVVAPVLDRVVAPCRQAMKDAGLRTADLDGVVLVGGSTRMPQVRAFVESLFGRRPLAEHDPDQVVALGAAIQADLLSEHSDLRDVAGEDILLLDITPLSLGLETMGGVSEKIIPRGSKIPVARSQAFTTFADGQTGMDVHVVQGERELVADCRSLARFRLEGIPPKAAGAARVEVTFSIDADGILQVGAREETTGTEQTVRVEPSHGLSDEQVEQMLRDSFDHAQEDVEARALATARVEAQRVLAPLHKAMKADADLLNDDERGTIGAAISELEAAVEAGDSDAINGLVELLDKVSGGFAHRRMERALRAGLADVNVDELERELD